ITLAGACSSNRSTTACQISSLPFPQGERKNTALLCDKTLKGVLLKRNSADVGIGDCQSNEVVT
ncbi:hypothetical protein, partial [Ralstonia pseudosolanacearum]|uniref:hypothetical protein n=1 Tax=Ralstonia pseudosolanacearum TaxID=1310165 RepID=UPI002004B8ED